VGAYFELQFGLNQPLAISCITTKKIGDKWFLVFASEDDMDEEDEIEDELDLKDEGTVEKP
jgi:hypothetical protein